MRTYHRVIESTVEEDQTKMETASSANLSFNIHVYVFILNWCYIFIIVIIIIIHRIFIVNSSPVDCFTTGAAAIQNVAGFNFSKVIDIGFL